MSAQFTVAAMAANKTMTLGIQKGGTNMFYAYTVTAASEDNTVCASGTLVLAAADVITVVGYHNHGSSRNASHSNNQNHLSIQRVA